MDQTQITQQADALRAQIEAIADKLNDDPALQQQMIDDPTGVLVAHGVSEPIAAAIQEQASQEAPEVQGHWFNPFGNLFKGGGSTKSPIRANPSYNYQGLINSSGGRLIGQAGGNIIGTAAGNAVAVGGAN